MATNVNKDEKKAGKARNENAVLKDILTEKELSEYLNVSVYIIRRLRVSEGLPTLKFDNVRAILYYRPAVEDWLRARSLPWNGEAGGKGAEERSGKGGDPVKYGMAPIPD